MHSDEIEVGADLVRRLLAEQFPHWAALALEPVASAGTINALYRLGDDLVIRLPRVHWGARDVIAEHRWLPRLAPRLPVPIPVPVALGRPAQEYPWHWSISPWLVGDNPLVGIPGRADELSADIARFIAELHQVEVADGPAAPRGGPLVERDAPTRAALVELTGVIDVGGATAAWESALRAPNWAGAPVWQHGDLSPGNLLCADGRLTAVIDFGCVGVGDPACDCIVAWNLLPTGCRESFRAALGVDDATWARGRGWALSIALIQLPYYRDTNPVLAQNSRHTIGEVLNDS